MLIRVDTSSEEALYLQIAAQIRRGVNDGSLTAGEKLPPGRQLAETLDVNMHTVLRAYGELRDEGLLDMRRGRGVTITEAGVTESRARDLAAKLAAEARRIGLTTTETLALVEAQLQGGQL